MPRRFLLVAAAALLWALVATASVLAEDVGVCQLESSLMLTTPEGCLTAGGEYIGPEWVPTG